MNKAQVAAACGEMKTIRPQDEKGKSLMLRADTMAVVAVLCSQSEAAGGPFAVASLANGGVVAVWKEHAHTAGSVDELKGANVLNRHELALLEYGVGSDA